MAIRYSEDGDIEAYDEKTGKTTGHISTMGNMIDETEEDRRRNEEDIKRVMKKCGLVK
jgi:hypothetical protein